MKILIFPTDTVYGIGCSVFDKEGMEKIYEIKHRPKDKPLACLCANMKQIDEIAYLNDKARKIINVFMPGALTLILKAKENVKEITGFDTIGVRIPNSKIALKILIENGAMLTTSVNESGKMSLNDYNQIVDEYGKLVDKVYKPNGEKSSNKASTVLSIINGEIKILREGEITLEEIKNVLK